MPWLARVTLERLATCHGVCLYMQRSLPYSSTLYVCVLRGGAMNSIHMHVALWRGVCGVVLHALRLCQHCDNVIPVQWWEALPTRACVRLHRLSSLRFIAMTKMPRRGKLSCTPVREAAGTARDGEVHP